MNPGPTVSIQLSNCCASRIITVSSKMRYRFKIFSLMLCSFVTMAMVAFSANNRRRTYVSTTTSTSPSGPLFSLAPLRHVTKSLAELGPMSELNPYVLFFNHAPNCGSEMLVLLLQWLQGRNNFKHIRLKSGKKKRLSGMEQEAFIYEVGDLIKRNPVPLTFDGPLHFINFTSFDRQSPTFLNIVRDPLEKFLSKYYNKMSDAYLESKLRKCIEGKRPKCALDELDTYEPTIPYFCGQDSNCLKSDERAALKIAKRNVERYYPVVGVLEEFNSTLEMLERKLPYFFKGISELYRKNLLNENFIHNKRKISPIVQKYFRLKWATEYQFYDWIKARLYQQLNTNPSKYK